MFPAERVESVAQRLQAVTQPDDPYGRSPGRAERADLHRTRTLSAAWDRAGHYDAPDCQQENGQPQMWVIQLGGWLQQQGNPPVYA